MARKTKPVFLIGTGQQFPSAAAAAKALGINSGNVYSVLAGRRKSAGGYQFGYASNRAVSVTKNGTTQVYSSVKSAARAVGANVAKVESIVSGGIHKTVKGYEFSYVDASKVTSATSSASSASKKNRKANKYEHIKQHREQKKAKLQRQEQKRAVSAVDKLKIFLSPINAQLDKYYKENMMGYSRAAQNVAEFQNYLGGTDDFRFDLSDENLKYLSETMTAEEIETWMNQIKDEIKSQDNIFWDLKKQLMERETYALEFGVLPSELDEIADLLPDLWDVMKLANTKQKKGSKTEGQWDAIRDSIQGNISRQAFQDVIGELKKFWSGEGSRKLKDILSDLDQYRAKSSPLAENIDENNLPF